MKKKAKRFHDRPLTAFLICPILIPPRERELMRFVQDIDQATERLVDRDLHPVFLAKVKEGRVERLEYAKKPLSRISVHEFGKASDFSLRQMLQFGIETRPDIVGMIQPPKFGLGGPDDTAGTPTFEHRLVKLLERMLDDGNRIDFVGSDEKISIALREDEFASWVETVGQDPFRHFLRMEMAIFRSRLLKPILTGTKIL